MEEQKVVLVLGDRAALTPMGGTVSSALARWQVRSAWSSFCSYKYPPGAGMCSGLEAGRPAPQLKAFSTPRSHRTRLQLRWCTCCTPQGLKPVFIAGVLCAQGCSVASSCTANYFICVPADWRKPLKHRWPSGVIVSGGLCFLSCKR